MKNQGNKTFYDLYDEAKSKPTPAMAFIKEIADLTHASENTVRMWFTMRQQSSELAKSVIANRFGSSIDVLFPKRGKNN